jgi:hypothetical protein
LFLRVERRHLRLNPMNIIVERENGEPVVDLDVRLAMLSGSTPRPAAPSSSAASNAVRWRWRRG